MDPEQPAVHQGDGRSDLSVNDRVLIGQGLSSGRTPAPDGALAAAYQYHDADRGRRTAGDGCRPRGACADKHHDRHLQPLLEKLGQNGSQDAGKHFRAAG